MEGDNLRVEYEPAVHSVPYVTGQTRLGNIMETPIEELAADEVKRTFSRKRPEIDSKGLVCRHLNVCRGGGPKDRAMLTGTHKAPSYFCEGYKIFFDYACRSSRDCTEGTARPLTSFFVIINIFTGKWNSYNGRENI